MISFNIFTIFPEMIKPYFDYSILKKAQDKKIIKTSFIDFREYADDKHKKVDDEPYGGGPGMLLKIEPIVKSLENYKKNSITILLSPKGKTLNQNIIKKITNSIITKKIKNVNLVCGRYEGIDYRIQNYIDYEISIGNFVITGGELAACVFVDAISRNIKGVLKSNSLETESFINDLLEYPQYTRPRTFRGQSVPEVLLSGDHKKIKDWRLKMQKKLSKKIKNESDDIV